ncbi:MAG: sterol desaturase family protein, partial [Kangiellaceae bacterium]|nr:sterol desaturase family protein [Kangiellaceae bacterium]
ADSPVVWLFSFVFYDFLYYWFHRFSHQINFLWASHVVHHQSEEYNLTTALRQTSSSVFVWIFYLPSFVIGIPAEVFFVSGALNLIYQYWVHTQLIGKLGWFESVFVTPSHHRVHHGQNEVYIDKNHGGVFILWDKIFGTFQQELDCEKVVYGVRRPVNSFNPIWANFHTWMSLLVDAFRTKNWLDKIRIWFMPTGWRPKDVELSHPIKKQVAGTQVKYDPQTSLQTKYYAIFQYIACMLFSVIFILEGIKLEFSHLLVIWICITLPLVTSGLLLEGYRNAKSVEMVRVVVMLALIFVMKNKFPLQVLYFIQAYLILTILSFALFFKLKLASS